MLYLIYHPRAEISRGFDRRIARINREERVLNTPTKTYRYYFRLERYLPSLLVLIFSVLFLFYFAASGRALRIMRLIRLDPPQAAIFCTVLGLILTAILIWSIIISLYIRKQIVIHENRLSLPVPTTGKTRVILFSNIAYVTETEVAKERIATIVTKQNQQIHINMSLLDSEQEYQEILSLLREKQSQSMVNK
jgi:hypothetical protein